ncbi:hypothetical protein L342_3973 [Escherichia coli CE516]|nr:hypothetical protein L342_3973 [Escherichia coli CE516]
MSIIIRALIQNYGSITDFQASIINPFSINGECAFTNFM